MNQLKFSIREIIKFMTMIPIWTASSKTMEW